MLSKNIPKTILMLLGSAMLLFALAVSSDRYSLFLLGDRTKDLSWGPTLFRVLLAFHGSLLLALSFAWERIAKTNTSVEVFPRQEKTSVVSWATLIFLGVMALALRLWHLNTDLWIDELLTLLDFSRKPIGVILTSFPSQNQHMLYSILSHASITLFGESSWALRLPSVLFGVASIFALFFLCRRFFGSREALLCAALMTVSYHHIWFSQNARGYMGLLLFTLLATHCWLEALETNAWKWWIGYVASVVLGMWLHSTMLFVVAAQGLVYLALLAFPNLSGEPSAIAFERRAGLRPWVAWVLIVSLTLQLYALALPEFLAVGLHEESKDSEWTNIFWVVSESIRGLSIGFVGLAVVVCGAAFVAFGWFRLFQKDRRFAVLMILPALLAGGTMLGLGHNIWPRFFFFSMGFGLLIIVHGVIEFPAFAASFIDALRQRPKVNSIAGVGLTFLIIIASLFSAQRNYALPKQDFSGAKNYVDINRSPNDQVVVVSLAGVFYDSYLTLPWRVAKTGVELEELQKNVSQTWLIYTLPIEVRAFRPDVWHVIERDYKVVRVFPGTLNGGEIFVCQKRTPEEENK